MVLFSGESTTCLYDILFVVLALVSQIYIYHIYLLFLLLSFLLFCLFYRSKVSCLADKQQLYSVISNDHNVKYASFRKLHDQSYHNLYIIQGSTDYKCMFLILCFINGFLLGLLVFLFVPLILFIR